MSLIGRFEHLPNRPKSDEARPLLEKIASQVKPIMQKRDWKVGTLAEFLPANPALLGNNMNAGQRINLRLRPPGDTNNFYEYDQLVLVMLHELTHNVHGPHDAQFYKLLAELEEEYYDLKRKGYSGEGFHSAGNHLSGLKVDEYHGKAKGLAAAEKRLAVQKKIGKGGVLGGSSVKGRTMQEVIAEAAERRMRDDKACSTADSGHAKEVEEEVRKAAQESVGIDVIDLAEEDEDDKEISAVPPPVHSQPPLQRVASPSLRKDIQRTSTAGSAGVPAAEPRSPPEKRRMPITTTERPSSAAASARVRPATAAPATSTTEWSCPTCTLLNPIRATKCAACETPKPARPGDGETWWCEFCGAGPRDKSFWSCIECGTVRKWG